MADSEKNGFDEIHSADNCSEDNRSLDKNKLLDESMLHQTHQDSDNLNGSYYLFDHCDIN